MKYSYIIVSQSHNLFLSKNYCNLSMFYYVFNKTLVLNKANCFYLNNSDSNLLNLDLFNFWFLIYHLKNMTKIRFITYLYLLFHHLKTFIVSLNIHIFIFIMGWLETTHFQGFSVFLTKNVQTNFSREPMIFNRFTPWALSIMKVKS